MKDCKKIEKNLVAFLYGELRESEREQLKSHLLACSVCKRELEGLEKITKGADALTEDVEKAIVSVDWETLPSRIAENVFEKKISVPRQSSHERMWKYIFQPSLKPVFVGLLLGLVLGSLVTYMIFWSPQSRLTQEAELFVSQDFLERVELEMARRETLNYLDESQYLLLDFLQSPSEKSTTFWLSDYAAQRTRGLLAKKKYINPQLEKFQMAKAKAICDQIELLFYELAQISDQLSKEDLEQIQHFIEEKQILLKIKLLKKDLEKSEV